MRAKNLVVKSINAAGEDRCVDIFCRPDGTFGFDEYRRDVEDQRGLVCHRFPWRQDIRNGDSGTDGCS